ncbi:MAG: MFS transporter, partial [Candidatus Alcyoniella australis]|nr:MFS transporter [Candidatus Alcyoniella australis]
MQNIDAQQLPAGRMEQWGLPLLLISLANLFSAFVLFLLPLYLDESLHYSGLQIGVVFGAFNISALVGAVPFGLGNDRRRSRVLVSVSVLLVAVAALALSETQSFSLFVAAFVIFGVGVNLFRISLDALIYRTNRSGSEGWRLAVYHSFRMGAFGLGTLLVAWQLDRIGFPMALK